MSDWKFLQKDPSESLARLHYFSITKQHPSGEIEACITIKEFAVPKRRDLQFFACADIQLNQNALPFHPSGWSETMMGALSECLRNFRLFEYEAPDAARTAQQ
ncbi:MAG TPA: hypothetical protein VFI20_05940 [Terracidiphilus sp.]|nr:hypothetical protein [Terracidiphilus sp.]